MKVHEALAQVMADVRAVGKHDRNQAQGFSFRGIDATVNAVGPALRAHGVVVLPELLQLDYGTVEVGAKRTPMAHVQVRVRYLFVGPEGDQLAAVVPGEAMDSGDKGTAKAMSVAFRTALLQALALPTDDPDPDSTSYERAPAKELPEGKLEAYLQSIADAATQLDLEALLVELQQVAAQASTQQANELRTAYRQRLAQLAGAQ